MEQSKQNMASLTNEAAASSSSSSSSLPLSSADHQNHYTYEVFLSFRGEDTRFNFTDHLYNALCQRGIETFRDDELQRGEEISSALVKAIEESRVSIIVFSQNYASSRWCLDELVKILDCRKSKGQVVRPVFYKVDPSDVRFQRGAFGDAFATLGRRYEDSMDKWKTALKEAADLSGWPLRDGEYENKFIDHIVGDLSARVINPSCELHVAEHPIGLESCVQDVIRLLHAEENIVRMVGIWGPGGIGKTTIAKAVFNSIRHVFESSCFLADVRSNLYGLAELQERLLFDILRDENLKVHNVDVGVGLIKTRMRHKNVLLILDDVSHSSQLQNLVPSPDCFGPGSRILITTRGKRWLIAHQVDEVYEVKMLDDDQSLELFSFNAFKRNGPPGDYLELAQRAVRYAQGLPLALIVLGSHLFHRSREEWEATLDSCRGEDPHKLIRHILKISYDATNEVEPTMPQLNLSGRESPKELPDLSRRQATNESEPTMPQLNLSGRESLKELPDLSRRQATNESEPTMPQLTEDFEAVEATTEATNGNSEPAPQWKHDVFLSFRGEDTRKGFLSHLYHELQNTKVIRTFKDDEQLEKGKDISHSLLTAIEESRFAIIVLSENYAFSAWCLDELTKIFECMEGKDTILPIFYHVAPSDIRRQKGQFEVAFTKHESYTRYDREKVKQWRADLTKVGNLSGWDSNNHKSERELIEDIVKVVLKKVSQTPRGDFEEFEATREAMDKVKEMLNDVKITAIGVYGREGVGKTAMVKHVGAQAKRIGLFDHVVLAVISENPDLQKIQGELVNQLGLELVVDEEIERASRLKERIMGGKRILIILDDIREIIDLSSIGIPSYDELQRCNSKVLLTTRIRNICQSMGCQAHVRLNILSEQDSLKLFMKKSRKPFHGSTDSYDEERNVVSKCSGLPSVLEEAAREFGHKYVEEWNKTVSKAFGDDDDEFQKAAQELNASQPVPTKDGRDTFKGIELSYHTLRFDDAKSFFLLCCMFPEDYDIPIEDLFKYGIGKGLLQYSDTLQEARDTAHSLVAYLKDSGLLLDGKKGCIKMNFDVRKAISIALSEGHAFFVKAGCELKDWPMDAHEGYSAISLMRNKLNKLPETLVCSELQILLLQSNAGICDIPQTFFQSPNALRVFDLSYTSISVLPSSFSLLTNLQALHLDCCKKITDISVLGKLKKVEILSLRKFPLKELPEEIGNLTSLRMLDVTGGCVHKIPSEVISRLYRLEELYMKCEFGDWGSKVEEAGQTNADFDEIIGLSHLNILKVYISDAACLPKDIRYFEPNWVKFDICISRDLSSEMMLSSNDQPSRTLTLDRTINGLSDWFINVVTEKAEKLEYRECKGLKNILKEYEHGRLHGLKHLSVIGCHESLEELINVTTWDPSKPVFERLEELHLLHLQCLKELCVCELPLGSLCNLKLLKVQSCCNLVNALLPPKLLQRLSNLETIFCVNMEHMKYVFGFEGLEPEMNLLRKLSEMRLCALFGLISIWNGPAPPAVFCNLKVLAVCWCTKLKSLFPFDVARSLLQLEDLSVEHCPSLGRVIEASNSLNRFIPFVALKKLVLKNLPELTWFCTENGTIDIECPWLEYLYVNECPKCPQFINSASASVKLNNQQHLNSLVKRWKDMYNL